MPLAAPHPPTPAARVSPSPRERREGWDEGQPFSITSPLSSAGGAEITGLDLSLRLSDTTRDAIYTTLLRHQFLVFPGQTLSREGASQQCFEPLRHWILGSLKRRVNLQNPVAQFLREAAQIVGDG